MVKNLFTKQVELDPNIFGVTIVQGLGCLLYGEGENFLFAHPGNNYHGMISWLMGYPEKGCGFFIVSNGAMGELLSMEIISALVQGIRRINFSVFD